jgi:hypothetical protein
MASSVKKTALKPPPKKILRIFWEEGGWGEFIITYRRFEKLVIVLDCFTRKEIK